MERTAGEKLDKIYTHTETDVSRDWGKVFREK